MASVLDLPRFRYTVTQTDSNGNSYLSPASGYLLNIYEAGTTTRLTTYSDSDLTIVNANPLTLDADGAATVYFTQSAKVELTTAAAAIVQGFPVDGISPTLSASSVETGVAPTNGGMEVLSTTDPTKPANWTVVESTNGTVDINTTEQANGSNSLSFIGTDSGGAGTATSLKFDVVKSAVIEVLYSYFSTVATTTNKIQVRWYNSVGASISTSDILNASTGHPAVWTSFSAKATAPATAVQADIVLTGVEGAVTGTTYFDAIVSERSVEDGLPIIDANGNELLDFVSTASAVNEITITNAATANAPEIASTGDDTNVALDITSKGTGDVNIVSPSGFVNVSGGDADGVQGAMYLLNDYSDTAAEVTNTSTSSLGWTTLAPSVLSGTGAKIARVKIISQIVSDGADTSQTLLQRVAMAQSGMTPLGGTFDDLLQASYVTAVHWSGTNTQPARATDVSMYDIVLDGSQQFQYLINRSGFAGTATSNLVIKVMGYYV